MNASNWIVKNEKPQQTESFLDKMNRIIAEQAQTWTDDDVRNWRNEQDWDIKQAKRCECQDRFPQTAGVLLAKSER